MLKVKTPTDAVREAITVNREEIMIYSIQQKNERKKMKKLPILLAGALSLFFTGCSFNGQTSRSVPLTKDGAPAAKIVIAEKPAKAAHFGALELQNHLKMITGMEFPIITDAQPQTGFEIRVGESKRTQAKKNDFKPQQYLIDITPSYIELIGYDKADYGKFTYKISGNTVTGILWPDIYDEQGTMYAVYDFLEDHCGVTWIDPTDYGIVVKKNKNLKVYTTKKRSEPFMAYRGGTFGPHHYNPLLYKPGSAGAKRYNALGYKNIKGMTKQNALFLMRMRAGGEFAPANHSFYHFYDRFYNKKSRFFEADRPEFFAQGYTGKPPQLCYSNPETIKQVVKDVRDYFDNGGIKKTWSGVARPGYVWGKNYYCLEPMDIASFCKCKRCIPQYEPERKADHSDHSTYWFRFVNTVAKELKKSHPDKMLTTLAYMSHEGMPTNIRVEDNVMIYFCISANRYHYTPLLEKQLKRMEEWRKAYPKQQIAMWLYNGFPLEQGHNGNFHCFPGFFTKESVRQYGLFKKWNIRGGIFHCGFVDNVDNWVHLKLMMNPDYTADELMTRYFSAYGKAGKYIRKFYEMVEDRYGDKSIYPSNAGQQNVQLAWGVLGTPDFMAKLGNVMAAAEKAAETPEEKTRVKLWKLYVYDYMKEGFDTYQQRTSAPQPTWKFKKIAFANGDFENVNWEKLPAQKLPMYYRGGNELWAMKDSSILKGAHDGKYLYLELTEYIAPSKLVISPSIVPYDVWEFVIALQKGLPYRHIMSGIDGRIFGSSFGEINWRMGVDSADSGLKNYGIKCKTIRSKNHWCTRYIFPLDTMLNKPVTPGDMFYMNLARVTNPKLFNSKSHLDIFTAVTHSTVHTIDRAATVILEK